MNRTSHRWAVASGAAVLAITLAACGGADAGSDTSSEGGESSSASGSVSVDGSSTVYPMSVAAQELLNEENPDVQVTVGEAGTGGGFEVFCQGQTDISDASRPIEEDEVAVCEENGIEYTELQVATDALTVAVHPDLAVDCLTTDQLVELVGPKSKVTNWSDLDPSFPDQEISFFFPGTDSGTYDYMAADVVGDESETLRDDVESSEDDNVLVQGVGRHRGCGRLLRLHLLRGEPGHAEGAVHRRRQRLRRALRRDRPGRRVHAARPPAVHLRQQRQVRRQRGDRGLHRLLHREPRRHRRDRSVHPAERRALLGDAVEPREPRLLTSGN